MKRELIEDTIQKYQDLLDDEEHFQRLRNFFPRNSDPATERMDQEKN